MQTRSVHRDACFSSFVSRDAYYFSFVIKDACFILIGDCKAAEYSSRFVVLRRVNNGLIRGTDPLENRVEVFSLVMN